MHAWLKLYLDGIIGTWARNDEDLLTATRNLIAKLLDETTLTANPACTELDCRVEPRCIRHVG